MKEKEIDEGGYLSREEIKRIVYDTYSWSLSKGIIRLVANTGKNIFNVFKKNKTL